MFPVNSIHPDQQLEMELWQTLRKTCTGGDQEVIQQINYNWNKFRFMHLLIVDFL